MKTLKYCLKEGLLADVDTSMQIINDFEKTYKKAEKDYKKLLAKTKGKSAGQFYCVPIKSPELAYILAGEQPAYQYYSQSPWNYDIDGVTFIYNIAEAFDGNGRRYIQVNVDTKSANSKHVTTIVASHIEYCKDDESIDTTFNPDKSLNLQECVKIISRAFGDKYRNIEQLKEAFVNNVKYTAKY